MSRGRGGIKVKRQGGRSPGCHGDLQSGFSGGEKRLLERGGAAKAGRRPLHDEPGSHWQQIPVQTEKSEGLEGRMDIMRGLDMQRSQFRGQSHVNAGFWNQGPPTVHIL